jgi:uncharacterized membrane-anchored protein YjiN (DUF445 family)
MTEAEKRERLRRMRLAALSAVALMLALFLASSLLRDRFAAAQWLRAFSEAGIAGALADWYAVVALFRHPLGLPFPHTAIIPKNKDRIADSVGAFIETHFLTSRNVVDRLARLHLAATMSKWLRQPSNSRDLADLVCDLIPPTLETVDDAEIRTLVERLAVSQMESVDFVALANRLITTIVDLDLDRALVKRVLLWLRDWMSRNREAIKVEFGRGSRYTPGFLDAYIVNRLSTASPISSMTRRMIRGIRFGARSIERSMSCARIFGLRRHCGSKSRTAGRTRSGALSATARHEPSGINSSAA